MSDLERSLFKRIRKWLARFIDSNLQMREERRLLVNGTVA